jgi:hypothetical protein
MVPRNRGARAHQSVRMAQVPMAGRISLIRHTLPSPLEVPADPIHHFALISAYALPDYLHLKQPAPPSGLRPRSLRSVFHAAEETVVQYPDIGRAVWAVPAPLISGKPPVR